MKEQEIHFQTGVDLFLAMPALWFVCFCKRVEYSPKTIIDRIKAMQYRNNNFKGLDFPINLWIITVLFLFV